MKSGVLIVDDLYFIRILIREILEKEEVPIAGEAEKNARANVRYPPISPSREFIAAMPSIPGMSPGAPFIYMKI